MTVDQSETHMSEIDIECSINHMFCNFYLFVPKVKLLTHCGLEIPHALVTIGPGKGLVPDGTKPLPVPMFTDNQRPTGIH